MATFRLLADHYIGITLLTVGASNILLPVTVSTQVLLAGTIQTTADVGGLLPANWKPSGNSEPLDAAAVTLFYNAGPQVTGLVRQQWSSIGVAPPATYWKSIPATAPTSYQLTGLGAGLPAISQ